MDEDVVQQLAGRRVLLVEDEYIVAAELATVLQDHGAMVLGPVPTIRRALDLLRNSDLPDAAILDVNLRGEMIWPVVDFLLGLHVPILLSTGYDVSAIPATYAGLPNCRKPIVGRDVVQVLAEVLAGKSPT